MVRVYAIIGEEFDKRIPTFINEVNCSLVEMLVYWFNFSTPVKQAVRGLGWGGTTTIKDQEFIGGIVTETCKHGDCLYEHLARRIRAYSGGSGNDVLFCTFSNKEYAERFRELYKDIDVEIIDFSSDKVITAKQFIKAKNLK